MTGNLSQQELLQYAIKNGMIDTAYLQEQIEMQKRKELLEKHPYDIWEGKDGNWFTYLPDKEKGRVLKKRSTEDKIKDVVVDFWRKETDSHTVRSVFYEWICEKLEYGEIEKATYDRYETDFLRFFETEMANKEIGKITEDELRKFIKSAIKDNQLTAKAYGGLRTLILGIFKYSKDQKYTDISIYTFFGDLNLSKKIFRKKIKTPEKEVFTPEEIRMMERYIEGRKVLMRELGILLAISTGLRPGELSSLKPSDINLKERYIHVQRSQVKYKDSDGNCVIDVKPFPKTEAGDRYLLLDDKSLEIVKRSLRKNPFGDYLFEDEKTGKRITENGFNHKLARICDGVGIPRRTMHKLRKTYGTRLIDARVDDSVIMAQMGHADIKTTRSYYYYCNQDNAQKLDQLNKASDNYKIV